MATIVIGALKIVDTYYPYAEFCPRCQTTQTTRVEHVLGTCWWITFFIGLILFWPICYWLCCQSSKDTKHFCPSCGTLLAVRQGGC